MSLPYSETAGNIGSTLGLLVPITLGVIRGLFPQSGWAILFAAISGLAGWCSLHFSILIAIWSQALFGLKDMGGLGGNGAANAFASVLGWLPGVALFFVTLSVTYVAFKWLPTRLKKVNRPQDAVGDRATR